MDETAKCGHRNKHTRLCCSEPSGHEGPHGCGGWLWGGNSEGSWIQEAQTLTVGELPKPSASYESRRDATLEQSRKLLLKLQEPVDDWFGGAVGGKLGRAATIDALRRPQEELGGKSLLMPELARELLREEERLFTGLSDERREAAVRRFDAAARRGAEMVKNSKPQPFYCPPVNARSFTSGIKIYHKRPGLYHVTLPGPVNHGTINVTEFDEGERGPSIARHDPPTCKRCECQADSKDRTVCAWCGEAYGD